jgi:hypothetical protein
MKLRGQRYVLFDAYLARSQLKKIFRIHKLKLSQTWTLLITTPTMSSEIYKTFCMCIAEWRLGVNTLFSCIWCHVIVF